MEFIIGKSSRKECLSGTLQPVSAEDKDLLDDVKSAVVEIVSTDSSSPLKDTVIGENSVVFRDKTPDALFHALMILDSCLGCSPTIRVDSLEKEVEGYNSYKYLVEKLYLLLDMGGIKSDKL